MDVQTDLLSLFDWISFKALVSVFGQDRKRRLFKILMGLMIGFMSVYVILLLNPMDHTSMYIAHFLHTDI